MKLRSSVIALAAGTALPLLVLAAVLVWLLWQEQRDAFEQRYLERVSALSIALDRELDGHARTLRALGQSQHYARGDLRDFYEEVQRVRAAQPGWGSVLLADRDGALVFNSSRPFGAAPARTAMPKEDIARAFDSPLTVTPLFRGNVTGKHVVNVVVPLRRSGDAAEHVLAVGIEAAEWLAFLKRYPVAAHATLTLLDQDGTVIARTLNHDRWIGQLPAPALLENSRRSQKGSYRSIGLEGQRFYSAHSRSAVSGWTVATGVPAEDVEAALRRSTGAIASAALLAIVAACALAFVLGRRIAAPLAGLATAARGIAAGERPSLPAPPPIAELADLRRALAEAGDAVQERREADRRKDEFLATLAHELRNPLAPLRSGVALLRLAALDDTARDKTCSMMERQLVHMIRLIDDLMDVSRITRGRFALQKAEVDLVDAVRQAVELSYSLIVGARHDLTLELPSEPLRSEADATRVAQLVSNLLNNAARYTPPGGRIRLALAREGAMAVIRVHDNGVGIAAERLGRIFDLFAPGHADQAGLGIGLMLARRIAELHGGSVEAKSDGPGTGSEFIVRLPVMAGGDARAAMPARAPALSGNRVLVVDDNRDAASSLALLMEHSGNEVRVVHDGLGAIAAAREWQPQVVLLDLGMPGLDGYEVCRRMRGAGAAARIVAVTGWGMDADRRKTAAAGFDAHLVKPVSAEDIGRVLADAGHSARRSLADTG